MTLKKCCESVFDITTKRIRKCKLNRHFHEYCYIHVNVLFKKCATNIQKNWRGFYCRKKLNNLFYNLPQDLQCHVMKYVRKDHYLEKKWIPSIINVYKKRICYYDSLDQGLRNLYINREIGLTEYRNNILPVLKEKKYNIEMYLKFTGY